MTRTRDALLRARRILVAALALALLASVPVRDVPRADAKPASDAARASGGERHTLVARADGTVWAFGSNEFGQSGSLDNLGSTAPNPQPQPLVGLHHVVAVAAGGVHSLVLRSDGTVWAFGSNASGQLGSADNSGTTTPNPSPRQVELLGNVVAISAGGAHSLALQSDGTVWAFGSNASGQLGTAANSGTTTPNPLPRPIFSLNSIVAISAGGAHSLALRSDGTVWAFGSNRFGQLGVATGTGTDAPTSSPRQVLGAGAARSIAAGGAHSLLVDSFGGLWAFGSNAFGQLGTTVNSGTDAANPTPRQVAGLTGIADAAAGGAHSLARRSDRTVWAFGSNESGQLGAVANFGSAGANPEPTQVTGVPNVNAVAAGGEHNVLLPFDGSTWTFGGNRAGQLGVTQSLGGADASPQRVIGLGKVAPENVVRIHVANKASSTVIGNLTIDQPAGGGYTTVYPCLEGRPTTSNSNFEADVTTANLVTVRTDIGGFVCVYSTTFAHVIWDQIATPTAFTATNVLRLLDTRLDRKVEGGTAIRVHVSDTPHATVLGNLTVDRPEGGGFLTAYPCAEGRPMASNLNFELGQSLANFAAVRADASGDICVYTPVTSHLLWDQVVDTTSFTAGNAVRLVDTRFAGKLAAGEVVRVHVTDTPNATVLGNLTVDRPDGGGFTTAYPCAEGRPGTSNSNFVPARTIANFVVARADSAGDLCLYTSAPTHLLWDQVAATTAFTVGAVTRLSDTRL